MDTANELLIDSISDTENSEGYCEENFFTSPEEETQPTYKYSKFLATKRHTMDICDE